MYIQFIFRVGGILTNFLRIFMKIFPKYSHLNITELGQNRKNNNVRNKSEIKIAKTWKLYDF